LLKEKKTVHRFSCENGWWKISSCHLKGYFQSNLTFLLCGAYTFIFPCFQVKCEKNNKKRRFFSDCLYFFLLFCVFLAHFDWKTFSKPLKLYFILSYNLSCPSIFVRRDWNNVFGKIKLKLIVVFLCFVRKTVGQKFFL
jgi:hypothetical protein